MKSPTETSIALQNIADMMRVLFPEVPRPSFGLTFDGPAHLRLHGIESYAAATALMQRLGIGEREKSAHDAERPWGTLAGHLPNGIEVTCFHDGLAPSCSVVTEMVDIPKTQTVDTGEFIQVPKRRIVCGESKELLALREVKA